MYIYTPPARAPSGSSDGFTTWAHPGLSRSLCSDQRPDGSNWRPSGSSALPYSAAPSASITAAFSHRVRVVRRGAHLVRELHYSGTGRQLIQVPGQFLLARRDGAPMGSPLSPILAEIFMGITGSCRQRIRNPYEESLCADDGTGDSRKLRQLNI
ncbi:hypothetical protein M514_27377 [Trichuris suis]|uniref:Uncharacterized protein n=1 Tax=Trichuris suis TaxID=68888 RepID=A0A085MT74_9BILA|nr:hypothetical protein M514_27377 [Trichuris suis]